MYGGLVTRYPARLAIGPEAWQLQWSSTRVDRGWELRLSAEPAALEFFVHFTPDVEKPSPASSGVVGCVEPGNGAGRGMAGLPATPHLPDQAEPNHTGPCTWTPPGPGSVTIQARMTYTVTLWTGQYTASLDDYVWTSEPSTFVTGSAPTAVNLIERLTHTPPHPHGSLLAWDAPAAARRRRAALREQDRRRTDGARTELPREPSGPDPARRSAGTTSTPGYSPVDLVQIVLTGRLASGGESQRYLLDRRLRELIDAMAAPFPPLGDGGRSG